MAPKILFGPVVSEPGVIERVRDSDAGAVRESWDEDKRRWLPSGRFTESLWMGRSLTPAERASAGIPDED